MRRHTKNKKNCFTLHTSRFTKGGFTLVETLAAISILTIALTGPMVIAQKGIASAIYAKDQITAFYLAQEAIEYIRNVRDSNRVNGDNWLSSLGDCMDGDPCKVDASVIDFHSGAITDCSGSSCLLRFNTTSKIYGHQSGSGWQDSKFRRHVSMSEFVPGREAVITVTIEWEANVLSGTRSFTVTEHIFNLPV